MTGIPGRPPRVGFVVHVMNVAGAEMLVSAIIHRLQGRIEPSIFCLDGVGALGDTLQKEGVRVIALHRRPGFDLRVAWRLARAIRSAGVDVIHAHQYTPFFYSALAAPLSGRWPRLIFTEHGRHYPDVVSARRRLANRLFLDRAADSVNAVCGFSARCLSEHDGFRLPRIEVIQNGIAPAQAANPSLRGALRASLGFDPERRYVAMIARFHPVKDHPMLLRAFARVANLRPDVDLLLVGDGALRDTLVGMIGKLGIANRVRLLGVRNDVLDILRAVDVFALTSLSEASSITLLEALACETPVVATDVGGNPEIVRNGIDGLLVPRGDARAAAEALLHTLDDPLSARARARAGGERVRRLHRLEQTVERYYELYSGFSHAS